MSQVQFVDRGTITGTRRTADGYLVAEVHCARTGIQQYLGTEIGLVDNNVVNVYRPENAVFSKDSMSTYVGKPVTLQHPPEAVTADNWKQYAVGDIGEEIARDGEAIRVSIKLMDSAAIKAVEDGTREISMGYTTPLEITDGVTASGDKYQAIQTGPIRINHLALVDRARGGSELRIGDADKWGVSPSTNGMEKDEPMTDLKTVVLGDEAVNVSASDSSIIEKYRDAAKKALTDAEDAHTKAIAAKDAEIAKLEAKIDDAKGKILSDGDLDKRVADRAELISTAKAIVSDVETAGLSDASIRKAVVVAKLGDKVADKSEAYIDARFDILAEDATPGDQFADTLKTGAVPHTDHGGEADKAFAQSLTDMSDAWKSPFGANLSKEAV